MLFKGSDNYSVTCFHLKYVIVYSVCQEIKATKPKSLSGTAETRTQAP